MNNKNLKEMSLDEIKKSEIGILLEIDKICKENNINYALTGGTLLGAVRHHGFIPWDDDIDIMMTRKNYDKFIGFCGNKIFDKKYKIITFANDKKYFKLYSKFVDLNTLIIDSMDKTSNQMGLFVDIFPIDYMEDSREESISKFAKSKSLRAILSTKQWKHFSWNRNKSFSFNILRFLSYVFSHFISKKFLIKKIKNIYPNVKKKFSANVCGAYFEKEIVPTYICEDYSLLSFEGHELSVPKKYDEYLKAIYGDYMTLPPVEKRVSNHSFVAYFKGLD